MTDKAHTSRSTPAFATRAIHAGQTPDPTTGAVMQPMALSVGVRDVPADHRGRVIGLMSTGGSSLLLFGPLIASVLLSVGS